ncbi:acetyl-CoA acetyltransferase [Leptospira perolatii]|uniref:Acetyl-CoA acetyltransferase n=1 Tax=Leptospira perolatii TaxID=2023191 RepID=A0A2M9ZKQ5_9LEPT|nr:thiolase family protein [Leptospira perolatii]PJZ69945.1 acetyl-CoA acetyltransferase [Leptospira perolatii]PJZ72647.1 acetyl-CoA acetyltransferase [Leptospira perolatii]
MSHPVLLGVADSTIQDFPESEYKDWTGDKKVLQHYKKSLAALLDFLEMTPEFLKKEITDFVSIEPASLGKQGYGHSVRIANELGFTGIQAHVVDLGGASVTGAIGHARSILLSNPDSVVLVAGADVPKSAFRQVSDLKKVNETVCHPEFELETGATLISMYGLMMNRMKFEHNVTQEDLNEITQFFRSKAIGNPRAQNYKQEITEKQLSRTVADPYPTPMIAIVTDHGFATLLVSEKKAKEWKAKGHIRSKVKPVYLVGSAHTAHSEYFILKGGFQTPATQSGAKLFASSGYRRDEVDYAWIYDCFTGMVILQSSEYFGVPIDKTVSLLRKGQITVGKGKKIPINLLGGIMNYQAAMSISAATGLVDVAHQYGLYAQSDRLGKTELLNPTVSLLGGNGGIDSINSTALFSSKKPDSGRKPKTAKLKPLFLNRPGAKTGEIGSVWSSTVINFNPASSIKTPYSLVLVKLEEDRFIVANLYDKSGNLLKNINELEYDKTRVKIDRDKNQWKANLI